jgi:nitrile hydratase subunit beta
MNSAHDLGGMQGFGPIPETAPDGSLFHAEWEKKVLTLTLAMGNTGSWNIDQMRAARENMPPGKYLTSSYFEIWLSGLEKAMLARGMVTAEELQKGKVLQAAKPLAKKLLAADVGAVLSRGSPANRPEQGIAKFKVGEGVRTCTMNPTSHTRLPRYVRGRLGVVEAIRGFHLLPDTHAKGLDDAQWLYTIRFDASELWGADTTASAVYVDCWESYLL